MSYKPAGDLTQEPVECPNCRCVLAVGEGTWTPARYDIPSRLVHSDGRGCYRGYVYLVPKTGPSHDAIKIGQTVDLATRMYALFKYQWRSSDMPPYVFWAAYVPRVQTAETYIKRALAHYRAFGMDPAHPEFTDFMADHPMPDITASVYELKSWFYKKIPLIKTFKALNHSYVKTVGWTEMLRCDPATALAVISDTIPEPMIQYYYDPIAQNVTPWQ